jgi:uncharacterized protein (TIGR00297 family)
MPGESIIARFDLLQIIIGFLGAFFLAYASYKFNALSGSGAFGMIMVGTITFGLGGLIFAIPLIFFFISSSLISLIMTPSKRQAMIIFDKTGPRDIRQVLANGTVASACVILYFVTGGFIWFFPYLAALCEATSDTWATELGTLSTKYPVSITTLKRVEPGLSGGVTVIGTLAAMAGSLATMLSGYSAAGIDFGLQQFQLKFWLAAVNAGFAGAILDSMIGGSIQAMYRCNVCERMTEKKRHCGLPADHIRGWRFINNDMVNFISSLFAAAVVAVIFFA